MPIVSPANGEAMPTQKGYDRAYNRLKQRKDWRKISLDKRNASVAQARPRWSSLGGES